MAQSNGRTGAVRAQPTVQIRTITPEEAEGLLGQDRHDRKVRDRKVDDYTAVMEVDEWGLSWDGIAIDRNGVLLNGQHRLQSVVRSGKPQEFIVVENMDPESSYVGDRGLTRLLSDTMELHGMANARRLASLVRAFWLFEQTGIPTGGGGMSSDRLTWPVAQALLTKREGIEAHITAPKLPSIPPSTGFLLSYLLNEVDDEDARSFLTGVRTGAELAADDVRYLLHKRLTEEETGRTEPGGKMRIPVPLKHRVAYVVYAWNAWRLDEPAKQLFRWQPTKQHFPRIQGWTYTDKQQVALGYQEPVAA